MFDLKAGVDLKEVEFFAGGIVDELDRAGGLVFHLLAKRHGSRVETGAHRIGETGGRRFLDHLLVPPLQ